MLPTDPHDELQDTEMDRVISQRLARLRTLPVDTSRLDRLLLKQIPQRQLRWSFLWLHPVRAIAASIVILAVIGAILLSSSGGPVLASPTQMAQFHEDLVSGRTPVMKVDSIEAANRMLADQSRQLPTLPNMPPDHVMACCMRSVKNKKVACVLLRSEETPITMTVANAADMHSPAVPPVSRHGIDYRVQCVGKLNMVMTERNGRWICLIGELPAGRLMDLAAGLIF